MKRSWFKQEYSTSCKEMKTQEASVSKCKSVCDVSVYGVSILYRCTGRFLLSRPEGALFSCGADRDFVDFSMQVHIRTEVLFK